LIDTLHGVRAGVSAELFVDRNLEELSDVSAYLENRVPYVSLSVCLEGKGDALTVDDSTIASAAAARLARHKGHEVTLFLNGYNIEESVPYFFSRLNAILDATSLNEIAFEGRNFDLRTFAAKQQFRGMVKRRLAVMASEQDRQNYVTRVGQQLQAENAVIPDFLRPISPADVRELVALGVDIQNHGWTHVRPAALSPGECARDIAAGRAWLRDFSPAPADLYAVPNGDCLPPWESSPHYRAWFLLDERWPADNDGPTVFGRRNLTKAVMQKETAAQDNS
jgi:hypothetical protein